METIGFIIFMFLFAVVCFVGAALVPSSTATTTKIPNDEDILASIDETINNVDKMLNEYGVEHLNVISKDTDTTTEYILTGINEALNRDFSWRFTLNVSDSDKEDSKLNILFKNQDNKETQISLEIIPFKHLIENFELLNKPIKRGGFGHYDYVFAISKIDKNKIEDFNGEIPYWEKTYMFSYPESFPNKEISTFYRLFKKEFLNGNYIELNGNDNYAFCLMFDILRDNKETIQKYLPILGDKYPITKWYVRDELGKRGLYSIEYNGKKYFYDPSERIYYVKKDFKMKNEILDWLSKSGEFSNSGMLILIDENGVIDAIADDYSNERGKRKCKVTPVNDKLPEYIKFGYVGGDFYYTNTGWNSFKDKTGGIVEAHQITSLSGSPCTVAGNFYCEKIGLTSLNGCPKRVEGDFIAKSNKLSSFVGMPKYIGGCFNISNNEFDDASWELAKNNDSVINDYNHKKNKFVKYRKELY